MRHDAAEHQVQEGGRYGCIVQTLIGLCGSVFLIMGLLLWLFRVQAGLTFLEQGTRNVTVSRVYFNAFFAGGWIALSSMAIVSAIFYKRWRIVAVLIAVGVFLLLVLSAVFEKQLYAAYLGR